MAQTLECQDLNDVRLLWRPDYACFLVIIHKEPCQCLYSIRTPNPFSERYVRATGGAGDKFTYPHREVGDPDRTSLPYPGLSRRVRHPALFVCTQETSEEVCSVI